MLHRRTHIGIALFGLVLLSAWSLPPDRSPHEREEIRYALLTWIHGVVNGDSAAVAALTHESYPNRDGFLRWVANSTEFMKVLIRYAEYEVVGDSFRRSS